MISNYRFKRQTASYGMFVGVTAEAVRTAAAPSADRIGLDVSDVMDAFRGTPMVLNPVQVEWLRAGLRRVAGDIARAVPDGQVTVVVRALEIVDIDYNDLGLAGAIAGWAAAEFGFPPHRAVLTRDSRTDRLTLDWA